MNTSIPPNDPQDKPYQYKKCTGPCGQEYPATLEYWSRNNQQSNGLHVKCKICTNNYNKSHRKRPEVQNRESAYYKEYMKRPDVQEKMRPVWCVRSHNRRALKKTIPGTFTTQQIQEKLKKQKHKCYYAACGYSRFKKVKGKYIFEIDHIVPITREGSNNTIDNIVLTCPSCNSSKNNKLPHEWPEGGRLL